jgi:apolipoprotein D and lipocalin family protein
MRIFLPLAMTAVIASLANAQSSELPPLDVVEHVDLSRYVGTWYEIARLPNNFQKKCLSNVQATYTLLEDGDIEVVNRCRGVDGTVSEAKGRAKLANTDGPNTKLKVRFAPAFLSFLPFVWGNYWIILLAPDYSYAVIGEPGREYLWILARAPSIEKETLDSILAQLKNTGYDLSRLLYTNNTAP